MCTALVTSELRAEVHAPEMSKGFGAVVHRVDDTGGYVSQDGGDVHDDSAVGF